MFSENYSLDLRYEITKYQDMRESITIRNFGPINEVVIPELRPLNVFVGKSGSGKSTIMKVLAAFQWIYKMNCVRSYLKRSGLRKSPFRFRLEDMLKRGGLNSYLRQDTEIIYSNNGVEFVYRKGEKLIGVQSVMPKESLSLEKIAFISDKRGSIPNIVSGMMSIRHGLYYLEDTLENFVKARDVIPETSLEYLGVKFEIRKTNMGPRIMVVPIGGADKYQIPLHEASSGIQSVSALHYIVEYFANHFDLIESMNSSILSYLSKTDNIKAFKTDTNIGEFPHRRVAIHIEEPELSLFPVNQIGLMEFIYSKLLNCENNNVANQVNVATHSPYLINHLNLMMKASEKNVKINGAALRKENVNLFYVNDGNVEDLMLQNAALVNTDVLSDDISLIYEKYRQLDTLE